MQTVLTRAAAAFAILPSTGERSSLRGLLAMLAQNVAQRVTLPHRHLPPEWFRFPLP